MINEKEKILKKIIKEAIDINTNESLKNKKNQKVKKLRLYVEGLYIDEKMKKDGIKNEIH